MTKNDQRIQNGTTEAHGKTWPLYEREAFQVEVLGAVSSDQAESLRSELLTISERYGLTITVSPVLVLEMSPEDRTEKEELDRRALAA